MMQTRVQGAQRSAVSRGTARGRNALAVYAKSTTSRITGRAPVLADPITPDVGFRLDPANNRWVRDDRMKGKISEEETKLTPKSGLPYTVWPVMHTKLVLKGMKSVTPEEALELQGQGWTIVDVRLEGDYEQVHAAGALSVPLFRYVEGQGFWDNVKKSVMAIGFAMRATERDPEFTQKALAKLKVNQKVLMMCSIGGSLDTLLDLRKGQKAAIRDADRAFGRESRALKASYELLQAGWDTKNMFWVEGGLQLWTHKGLPLEAGPDEE